MSYVQLVELAEKAKLHRACWEMGEAIAGTFSAVVARSRQLAAENASDGPSWEEIANAWRS